MARIATLEEILAASETDVALPGLTAALGEPRSLRVRKLSRAEFLLTLPPSPPGSDSWAKEDWAAKEEAWLATLDPAQVQARREALASLNVKIAALAAVDPVLTLEQAARLGDDAAVVGTAVLRFSGIGQAEPAPAADEMPAEVPVEPAA